MAITRIKNNQITDATIVGSAKLVDNSVTAGKLENNLTYGSNLTVTGNLTVNGTTTTVNSTTVTVDDPLLLLAPDQSGSGALDIGILGERGTDTNIALVWDESADEFIAAFTSSTDSSTTITVTDYADFHVGGLTVDDGATLSSTLNVVGDFSVNTNKFNVTASSGNTTVAGTLGVTGETTLASAIVSDLTDNRIVIAGSSGALEDSANFRFDGTNFDIGAASSETFRVAVSSGNTTVAGTLGVTGAVTANAGVTIDNINIDGTTIALSSGNLTLDVAGDIILDADGGDVTLADAGTTYGALTQSGGELVIKSGSTPTAAVTLSGANATLAGTLDVTGAANINDTTGSTSTSSGALIVDGGVGIAENAYVGGNIVVTGNLTVNGTTTTVNSTVTTVADPIMTFGQNTTDDNKDRGIEFKYNDGTAKVGFFGFDDSAGTFTALTAATNTSEVFSGTAAPVVFGNATVVDITATGDLDIGSSNFTVAAATGNTAIAGTLGVTGETTLASAIVSDLTDNRIVLAGSSGALEDDANLTMDGTTFKVGGGYGSTGLSVAMDGNTSTNGTLTVDGLTSADGGIDVNSANFAVATSGRVTSVEDIAITADSKNLEIGASADFTITHNGTDSVITNTTGILAIDGAASSAIRINEAGADVDTVIEGDTDTNLFVADAGADVVLIGTATATTGAKLKVGTTDSMIIPTGTTAQRPGTGAAGMIRFNSTLGYLEYHTGTDWLSAASDFTVIVADSFSGDGSTVAFTLSDTFTTASCIVSINGVVQIPTTAYGVSGTTLTFTEAPASGDVIDVRGLTTTSTVVGLDDGGGNATVDTNANGTVTITGDILPTVDNTYDLGSATYGFATIYGTATSAQYADLAEKYSVVEDIEPGTVVCFGGDAEVQVCDHDMDRKVAGVVSTDPAYMMNSGLENAVYVALTGRVPCKVVGPVRKGDMMVSAGNGAARAEENPVLGSVIGKALEDFDGAEGVIEVVVGRL